MAGGAGRGQRRQVTPRLSLLLLLAFVPLAVILGTREPALPVVVDSATGPFADGFLKHLESVKEAAAAVVDLGERRERNLLVVSQRQSAMNAALDATDAWLLQQATHQDDPSVTAYRTGAAGIRQAMGDAQSAFLHLDWDGIATANDTLKQGASEISTAVELLSHATGP